jgi:hypothetical protein
LNQKEGFQTDRIAANQTVCSQEGVNSFRGRLKVWLCAAACLGLVACTATGKIQHRALSATQAEIIQTTLRNLNQNSTAKIKFSGALRLGDKIYERYSISSGPTLLINIDPKSPLWIHASCHAHPHSVTHANLSGLVELSFEVMRNRPSDPQSALIETLGGQIKNRNHPDWMCNSISLPRSASLDEVIASQSGAVSIVDYERIKQSRKDALGTLRRTRASSVYKILSARVDQLLYEDSSSITHYGIPNLARQVGLLQRKAPAELAEITRAYAPNTKLLILLGVSHRTSALGLVLKHYQVSEAEDGRFGAATKTSTTITAQLSARILNARNQRTKEPPVSVPISDVPAYALLSWPLPAHYHPDFVPLQAASHLLAERLDLSEAIEIHTEQRRYGGHFQIALRRNGTHTATQAMATLRTLIGKLSTDAALPEQIKAIQATLERRFWTKFDDPFHHVEMLAFAELSREDVQTLQAEIDAIKALNRNQVIRVLSEYLVFQAPVIVVSDPRNK